MKFLLRVMLVVGALFFVMVPQGEASAATYSCGTVNTVNPSMEMQGVFYSYDSTGCGSSGGYANQFDYDDLSMQLHASSINTGLISISGACTQGNTTTSLINIIPTAGGGACLVGFQTSAGYAIAVTIIYDQNSAYAQSVTASVTTPSVSPPTISGVTPYAAGRTSGGTSFTISGTNLSGATVTIGGAAATLTNNTATTISGTAPAGVAGVTTLAVTTAGGTASTGYTYADTPTITSVSPAQGPVGGNTTVVITGTGFVGVISPSSVRFGSVNAASYTVNSSTQITAITPAAGYASTQRVIVVGVGGVSANTAAAQFTYVATPTVTAISPGSGPEAGGSAVVITGTDFTGATAVSFGATPASFTVVSATQITATVPAGTGTVDVRVTTAGGTSVTSPADQFTYYPPPTIQFLSRFTLSTNGGTALSIGGTGLQGATAVTFGGVAAASFTVNSSSQISVTAPAHAAGLVDVLVTTPGGSALVAGAVTYVAPPVIAASFSSASALVGDAVSLSVTITNPNQSTLTDVNFSSTYPPGISGYNAQATVCGGTVATTSSGLSMSGATLQAGASCNFSITVQASATGIQAYSTGPVGSGSPGQTGNTATASLSVGSGPQMSPASGSLPAATAGQAYSQTFSGSGGAAPYVFSAPYGGLPAGLVLNVSTGALAGTPTEVNSFNFVIRITDANSNAADVSYSMAVNPPTLDLTPSSLPSATVGTAYSQFATATGGIAPYGYAVTAGALPTGVTLSSVGQLSGVPAIAGTYTFTITATDSTTGNGAPYTANRAYQIGVGAGNQTIAVTSVAPGNATAGGAPYTVSAVASSNLPVSFSSATTGVCAVTGSVVSFLSAGTCSLSADQSGDASWNPAPQVQQSFAVSLSAPPQAPVITAPLNGSAISAQSLNVTGTAAGSAIVTLYLDSTAIGSTSADGSGNWSYAASNLSIADGAHSLTATATDAFAQTSARSAAVLFTVDTVTLPVVVTSPASGTLLAPGPITFTGTAEPGSTVTLLENAVLGTATADNSGNWSQSVSLTTPGVHSITVSASDRLGNPAATAGIIALTIAAAPVAADVTGVAVPFGGSGTAIDLATALTGPVHVIAIGAQPSHGTLVVAGTTLTYTPASGYYGADSFTYTATGIGGTSAPATVSLTVALPAAPVVTSPGAVTVPGSTQAAPSSLPVDLSATVSGLYSGIAVAAGPAHGTVAVTGAVAIYSPAAGFAGADSFTYMAVGPGGTSNTGTVSITVQGTAPVAANRTLSAIDGQIVDVDLLAGATGGPFTAAAIVSASQGAEVSIEQGGTMGSRSFTAHVAVADHFSGALAVHYTLTSTFGTSAQATITINVSARSNPANDQSVRTLSQMQAESALRFAQAQGQNFMRRMETLHGGAGPASVDMALRLTFPDLRDPGLSPVQRERAADMAVVSHFTAGGGMPAPAASAPDRAATARAAENRAAGTGQRQTGAIGVWTGGAIEFGTQDQATGREKVQVTSSGISLGADAKIAAGVTLGIGGGFGWDRREADGGPDMRGTNSVAVAYGSFAPGSGLFVDALVGTGGLEFRTRRPVEGMATQATARREGSLLMGSIAFGIDTGDNIQWSLYGRGEWMEATLDAYGESGAGLLSLRFDRRRVQALGGVVGGRIGTMIDFGKTVAKPRLKAEWRHEFQDISPEAVDYADVAGQAAFRIGGTGWASDHVQASVGSTFLAPDDWSLDLELGLRASSQQRVGAVRVELAKQF